MSLPLPAFRFTIIIGDAASLIRALAGGGLAGASGGFTDCSGIEMTCELFEYPEGGQNSFVHRLPTRSKPSYITLKRGMLLTSELWFWVRAFIEGVYIRKDGLILVQAQSGGPRQAWLFHRGLPMKWTGPVLAAAQTGIATESLVIAHEGLEHMPL
jgi:phage tail-like protein